jgi:hypothetical protein
MPSTQTHDIHSHRIQNTGDKLFAPQQYWKSVVDVKLTSRSELYGKGLTRKPTVPYSVLQTLTDQKDGTKRFRQECHREYGSIPKQKAKHRIRNKRVGAHSAQGSTLFNSSVQHSFIAQLPIQRYVHIETQQRSESFNTKKNSSSLLSQQFIAI